jgi:hypothetical protein
VFRRVSRGRRIVVVLDNLQNLLLLIGKLSELSVQLIDLVGRIIQKRLELALESLDFNGGGVVAITFLLDSFVLTEEWVIIVKELDVRFDELDVVGGQVGDFL